jgi:hypothetical protein
MPERERATRVGARRTSVHISFTFSSTILQCRSNALTRPSSLRLLRQLISTCGQGRRCHRNTRAGRSESGPALPRVVSSRPPPLKTAPVCPVPVYWPSRSVSAPTAAPSGSPRPLVPARPPTRSALSVAATRDGSRSGLRHAARHDTHLRVCHGARGAYTTATSCGVVPNPSGDGVQPPARVGFCALQQGEGRLRACRPQGRLQPGACRHSGPGRLPRDLPRP